MKDSEHVWFRDHIETHLADGLSSEERVRFESHLAACDACASEQQEALSADHWMRETFAQAQPAPGLEDRVIRKLREATVPMNPLVRRLATAATAAALLGTLGYVATILDRQALPEITHVAISEARPQTQTASVYDNNNASQPQVQTYSWKSIPPEKMAIDLGASIVTESSNFTTSRESDHNESADEEMHMKGDIAKTERLSRCLHSKDQEFLGYIAGVRRENLYTFSNLAPAGKPSTPSFFKPTELASSKKQDPAKQDSEETKGEDQRPNQNPKPPAQTDRKIIRTGEMEFEVESFESAYVQITKIVGEEGGFISATNSEKLTNGKVRGTVVVRVPPDRLDLLVLKLRALGDLRSQRINSQDVGKQYTDFESELRAARAMEERLINIIKTGKGEVKDLLEAEKQLGVYREKIEKLEGEIRYLANLISLSTLTIVLSEKDIKTPTYAAEVEKIGVGLEAEDVELANAEVMKAIAEAKGRILASDLKKYEAGQFGAHIVCEVAPNAAGPLIDRLKQLGRVARFDRQLEQTTRGGTGAPAVKIDRQATQFDISMYNLANIAPRQTVQMNLACEQVEAAYNAILARVAKAGGRVVTSNLNRQKPEQTTGSVKFEVKAGDADAVLTDVREVGISMRLEIIENPDTNNVTVAKRGYEVQLFSLSSVAPRETIALTLAARSVPDAYRAILDAARLKGLIRSSQLDERDRSKVIGTAEVEITRGATDEFQKVLDAAGDTWSRTIARSTDTERTVDTKVLFQLSVVGIDQMPPRESTNVAVEVPDVDRCFNEILTLPGRIVERHVSNDRTGKSVAKIVLDVPLGSAFEILNKIKSMGTVRVVQSSQNPTVPEGSLARARLDVTLGNADTLIPSDQGLGSSIRGGLSTSITWLLKSLTLIIIGLGVVGPWAAIAWLILRWVRRSRKTAQSPTSS